VSGGGDTFERFVWLLRHAKAVTDPPAGGTDHERPLAPRGRRDAAALGQRIGAGDLGFGRDRPPQLLLASSAARTTETAGRIASTLGLSVDRRQRLYNGSPTDVLAELRELDDGVGSVMVVGHNPATHSLALELLSETDVEGRAALARFPTCAVALLRARADRWASLSYGVGTLEGFAQPPYG
jgi:phosphohistidine phosphatase